MLSGSRQRQQSHALQPEAAVHDAPVSAVPHVHWLTEVPPAEREPAGQAVHKPALFLKKLAEQPACHQQQVGSERRATRLMRCSLAT
jgi:hypothetical protein